MNKANIEASTPTLLQQELDKTVEAVNAFLTSPDATMPTNNGFEGSYAADWHDDTTGIRLNIFAQLMTDGRVGLTKVNVTHPTIEGAFVESLDINHFFEWAPSGVESGMTEIGPDGSTAKRAVTTDDLEYITLLASIAQKDLERTERKKDLSVQLARRTKLSDMLGSLIISEEDYFRSSDL
jgi:hypothetical protein